MLNRASVPCGMLKSPGGVGRVEGDSIYYNRVLVVPLYFFMR